MKKVVILVWICLSLSLLSGCSAKPRVITKVEYIQKQPPSTLLESCDTPAMAVDTYRESLITLSKYKTSMKVCNGKVEAIRDYYGE